MKRIWALCCLLLLAGCRLAQDVGHARWQADNGQAAQAEATLRALSDDGYEDASLALADLYRASGQRDNLLRAGEYYRRLKDDSDRGHLRYVNWLYTMSTIDDSYREPAREALLERQASHRDVLPLLARFYSRAGDAYPPETLTAVIEELMLQPEPDPETMVEVLDALDHPEQFSSYLEPACGADPAAPRLAGCLRLDLKLAKRSEDNDRIGRVIKRIEEAWQGGAAGKLSEDDLFKCASILLKDEYGSQQIIAGLKLAALGNGSSDRLFLLSARYEYKRKILMPDEELLAGLERLAGQGDSTATRLLGRMYAEGLRVVDDPIRGEACLLKVKDDPEASFHLGRLYLSGKLGKEKLQDGVDALLYAARRGQARAYASLAETFAGTPGIAANPSFSWVFARMAGEEQAEGSKDDALARLLSTLDGAIENRAAAERLLQDERARRSASTASLVTTEQL